MSNRIVLTLAGCMLLAACASTKYQAGDPVVRVMPSKRYWVKPDATDDDARLAAQECKRDLRQDPRYMAAVNEAADIAIKWNGEPPADDRRLQRAARKASSNYFEACMQGKGYQFIPEGIPVK